MRASAADRTTGPVFVSLRKSSQLTSRRLTPKHINLIAQRYLGGDFTAYSLRASFVTVAKLNRADDSEIMNKTKHKTSAMIQRYTRLDNMRQHNAGKKLGLYLSYTSVQEEHQALCRPGLLPLRTRI